MFFLCRLMERKRFFYANHFNWSLTSLVIANHAIWQKSWSTSIVLTVFPWILEVNASKEEKRACPFSSLTPRRKKTTKSFCKVWVSKLAESDKGSYYNQEKWLKDDKASEKPIETTTKSSFTSFLASGASFLGQKRPSKQAQSSLQRVASLGCVETCTDFTQLGFIDN